MIDNLGGRGLALPRLHFGAIYRNPRLRPLFRGSFGAVENCPLMPYAEQEAWLAGLKREL